MVYDITQKIITIFHNNLSTEFGEINSQQKTNCYPVVFLGHPVWLIETTQSRDVNKILKVKTDTIHLQI